MLTQKTEQQKEIDKKMKRYMKIADNSVQVKEKVNSELKGYEENIKK